MPTFEYAYYSEYTPSSSSLALGDFDYGVTPILPFNYYIFDTFAPDALKPYSYVFSTDWGTYQISNCSPYDFEYGYNRTFGFHSNFSYNSVNYDLPFFVFAINVLSFNGVTYSYDDSVAVFGTGYYAAFYSTPDNVPPPLKPNVIDSYTAACIFRLSDNFVNSKGISSLTLSFPFGSSLSGDGIYLLYNFGNYLNSFAHDAWSFFNFDINGVTLWQIMFGSGFFFIAGFIVIKFFIPI